MTPAAVDVSHEMTREADHPFFLWIACPVCRGWAFREILRFTPDEFLGPKRRAYYRLDSLAIDYQTPFSIQKCRSCGYVFVNPRFRPELYDVVYNEAKKGKYDLDAQKTSANKKVAAMRNAATRAHILLALVELRLRSARPFLGDELAVFDYGCGFGDTLRFARGLRFDAWGVDIDRVRLASCRAEGLRVTDSAGEPDPTFRYHRFGERPGAHRRSV